MTMSDTVTFLGATYSIETTRYGRTWRSVATDVAGDIYAVELGATRTRARDLAIAATYERAVRS